MTRADVPHVGLFNKFDDAVHEAHFRAAIVRKRYQVYFDRANRWWQIRDLNEPVDKPKEPGL